MKFSENNKFVQILKKILTALIVGILGGVLGTVFHVCLEHVTSFRENHLFIIMLLPFSGLVIVAMYRMFRNYGNIDLRRVFQSVTEKKDVPGVMIPLIFAGTLITHMFGGSAGREGAALQIGGSLGFNVSKFLKYDDNNKRFFVTAGMSSVFSAMFGTPLTAFVFSLEVTGTLKSLEGIVLGLVSSFSAFGVSCFLGVSPVRFELLSAFEYTPETFLKVVLLSVLCACVCIVFAIALNGMKKMMKKYIANSYIRVFAGGFAVVILTCVLNTTEYNGAGMDVISRALSGKVDGIAFLLKIVFTSFTMSCGFKGGEIVPTFFIGATFGCFAGGLLGLNPAICAAIGFVALFSGMTKCPLAAFLLALEVFGSVSLVPFFLIAVIAAWKLSGKFGLYENMINQIK